jgi:hypothetical protein
MATDITAISTNQLREALGAILKHRDRNDYSPESREMGVTIDELTLSSAQILGELGDRRARGDEKYSNFQWDIHHLAEDCIMALGPEDGEAIDKLLEGIAEFRVKFGIGSCPSCRQGEISSN